MKYREFTIKVKRDAVDIVCAMLYNYPIQGVEIGDEYIAEEAQKETFVNLVEFENKKLDDLSIIFYISYEDDFNGILKSIKLELDDISTRTKLGSLELSAKDSDDEDWAHKWKTFYKPFMIGSRILIRPIWEPVESIDHIIPEIIVDIDPGMAFGSGTHETTSLAVKALDKYIGNIKTIIDIGCGSGILGIIAAKLGAEKGILIDVEQSACEIAKENVISNKTEDKLTVIHGNLLENISEVADLVISNIFAEVIIALTPDIKKVLKKTGLFISSGIIDDKEADVLKILESNGFSIVEVFRDGGWVSIVSKYI